MSYETQRLERKIKALEKNITELNALFIKNDEELRKKIRDIRITGVAGVCAAEFTLANRMGITMDVVLALLPAAHRQAIEQEISRRIAASPDTTDMAMRIAVKKYTEEGDDY
jgi:putative effector of murein hydrolase